MLAHVTCVAKKAGAISELQVRAVWTGDTWQGRAKRECSEHTCFSWTVPQVLDKTMQAFSLHFSLFSPTGEVAQFRLMTPSATSPCHAVHVSIIYQEIYWWRECQSGERWEFHISMALLAFAKKSEWINVSTVHQHSTGCLTLKWLRTLHIMSVAMSYRAHIITIAILISVYLQCKYIIVQ